MAAAHVAMVTSVQPSAAGIDQVMSPQLLRGERLMWSGQPDASRTFTSADVFLIPFSIMWGGFAIFWEAGVLTGLGSGERAPFFFILWGIPFVAIGLYMMFGRFWVRKLRRRNTFYAITDRRVLSVYRGRFKTTTSAEYIDRIPAVNVSIARSGRGSISFGSGGFGGSMQAAMEEAMPWVGSGWGGRPQPLTFSDVADVQSVADIVRRRRDELADAETRGRS